jgi:predicted anti-sigma-YlaC factor YlaD
VDCEHRQEQLGRLLDGEAPAFDQGDLFAHLGGCDECRRWFDTVTRIRAAVGRDRDDVGRAADAIPLPALAPVARRRARGPVRAWRLPVPMAAVLAIVLGAGGALVGARWSRLAVEAGQLAAQAGRAPVVVICSLPEVTVR